MLRILAAGRDAGVKLPAVVQATGISRPTAHRLVRVLIEEGLVEPRQGGRYAIGREISELALARPSRSPLLIASEPHLATASKDIGDTIFLTARTGNDALCVARKIGAYPIQVLSINVGARRPLGVSSAGIAILAAVSPADAERIVHQNASRFGPYKVARDDVSRQISAARRTGYFVRDVGLVKGTRSISAWISGPVGCEAAITVSAIRARLGPRREREVAELILRTAHMIQRAVVG